MTGRDDEQILHSGIEAHKRGKLKEAEGLYRSILSECPDHPDANHNLAVLLMAQGQIEEPLSLFRNALRSNPKAAQYWKSYVTALLSADMPVQAQQMIDLGERATLKPELVDDLRQELKRHIKLSESASHLNQVHHDRATGHSLSASLKILEEFYLRSDFDQAEELALRLTSDFPDHPLAWRVLGAIFSKQGRFEECVRVAFESVKLEESSASACYNLASALNSIGRCTEAEIHFRRAIELDPDLEPTYCDLGNLLYKSQRFEEAED